MHHGTEVLVVEKAGTVLKMVPYTENRGLAFIQPQGSWSQEAYRKSNLGTRVKKKISARKKEASISGQSFFT
jgi:hypothetical protein